VPEGTQIQIRTNHQAPLQQGAGRGDRNLRSRRRSRPGVASRSRHHLREHVHLFPVGSVAVTFGEETSQARPEHVEYVSRMPSVQPDNRSQKKDNNQLQTSIDQYGNEIPSKNSSSPVDRERSAIYRPVAPGLLDEVAEGS
jgi:hypothetical protein